MSRTYRPRAAAPSASGGAVVVALLAATALLLGGCSRANEVATQASSDGLRAELGGLLLSNLMVLAAGEGRPGAVLGAVANHGQGPAMVSIGLPGRTGERIEVAQDETVLLGPEDNRIRLEDMPEPPGAVVELRIVSDRDGELTRRVPVLDATLDHYEGLVPSPSPS